ncbi:MAG: hypothetical protein JWM68_3437 [Verrucomicrobiales bacterium]|nr:hypothetical protein [Verrucomicrobiales bacterium]
MFGKIPGISPLESRKQLLIAESEINRVQLLHEGRVLTNDVRGVAQAMRSVSSLGSAAALLVTGLFAYQRSKSASSDAKPSWMQTALKCVQMAGDLWAAFRAQR